MKTTATALPALRRRNGARARILDDNIARIDYNRLAELADAHNVPFDEICRRAESGITDDDELVSGRGLVRPSENWLTTADACAVIGISPTNFYTAVARNGHYSGIRWKTRSKIKTTAKRGCGVLFNRQDCEQLRKVRAASQIQWQPAARVFHAMQKGLI